MNSVLDVPRAHMKGGQRCRLVLVPKAILLQCAGNLEQLLEQECQAILQSWSPRGKLVGEQGAQDDQDCLAILPRWFRQLTVLNSLHDVLLLLLRLRHVVHRVSSGLLGKARRHVPRLHFRCSCPDRRGANAACYSSVFLMKLFCIWIHPTQRNKELEPQCLDAG